MSAGDVGCKNAILQHIPSEFLHFALEKDPHPPSSPPLPTTPTPTAQVLQGTLHCNRAPMVLTSAQASHTVRVHLAIPLMMLYKYSIRVAGSTGKR